ncbi:MAG: tRNA 2-thiouridine(34) synthase MnmA [Planctomycetes bacterium]|nr:tRNA 2-thiouridine(34) synthase MnmA [Planctomycetota bacterium]
MSRNGKVIVAMSGGVDSAVSAGLLKEQGYECIGVFMCVGVERTDSAESYEAADEGVEQRRGKHGCCSPTDAGDARAIAARLGMPFYVLNFQPEFERIIDYFVDEYRRARTPNPCIVCNIDLKFGKLLRYADTVDAEYVATGHYARVLRRPDGAYLARSVNIAKDQSYVLFGIRRGDLARCLFPVGEIAHKSEVREMAARLGLSVHDKPDSQEICFVPDNDHTGLIRARCPESQQPGAVVDATGRVLGEHAGVVNFTIGQRRGLGIAAGRPIYVIHLDAEANTVTVGDKAALLCQGLAAERVNWLSNEPAMGTSVPAAIKIRYTHTPAAGHIQRTPNGSVEAWFEEPQAAVTPGQAAVFYDGEIVLGGGWIRRSLERPAE